jgi:aryl sulfotransferase
MDDPKKIVWLASYPKSGNTWFRAFLTALLNPGNPDIDINNLYPTTIASSRQLFDEMAGVSSADLSHEEIERLRPLAYRQNAVESDEMIYHKIHDAWTLLPEGNPMFPADVTKAVVYFIRNPLDIAVSFAHHLSTGLDKTITIMNNPGYAFCYRTDRLHNQLRQKLLTWSGHVKSWTDDSGLPVLVLRYEDMKVNTVETFTRAVSFLGLNAAPAEIETALEQSSFNRLKQQEEEKGFIEKSARSASFFRKGIVGDWWNVLSQEQVKHIISAHREVMERFGYLSNE